jgi:cell division septation protein DedD
MTERRYGFRFNAVEAGVLVMSVLLTSVLIFLSGVYVGKGVEAHRTVEQTSALRMPITITNESRSSVANTPLAWKLPKDKPTASHTFDPSVAEEKEHPPTSSETQSLATPIQKGLAQKTPVTDTLSKERSEKSEEKVRSKTEDQALVSAKDKPRLVKEASLAAREKVRTEIEDDRELALRTAAVQSRPNDKDEGKKVSLVPAQKMTSGAKKWKVQVEATSREEVAQEIARSLRAQGYAPSVSKVQKEGEVLYRIRVGKFATQEEAVAAIGRFRRDGKFSQAYPVSE